MSRLLAKFSSLRSTSDDDTSSSPKANEQSRRRREQVRRAQRTHRERRAKYLKGLEAEVQHLRDRNAANVAELNRCKAINDKLRALLVVNGISIPPDLEIVEDPSELVCIEVLGAAGEPQSLRAFQPKVGGFHISPDSPIDVYDPQIAIEFVLALEHPCLPDNHNNIGQDGEIGHSIQLQAAAIQNAPPAVRTSVGQTFPTGSSWTVLKTQLVDQLERLYASAMRLNLGSELTPVMCWQRVKEQHMVTPITRGQLHFLQRELTSDMVCYGFGAVIDDDRFNAAMTKMLLLA